MRSLRALAAFAVVAVLGLAPVLSGCDDDKNKKIPEAFLPASVLAIKGGPIGEVAPPAAVIAWGGASDFEKLGSGVQAFMQQVTPLAPPVLDIAKDEVRRKLAFTRLEGIDWKRPARVAIFDPKGMPKASLALILGLASKEQFLANLPAVKKENDEGNAITYRDDLGRTVCLSFIDDAVVVTWEKKQLTANLEFFVRLARSTIAQEQAFFLSAQNVSTLYAKDIDEQIAQAKQLSASQMLAAGMPAEMGAHGLTWMVSLFKDLDKIEAVPLLAEDGVALSLRLHPREGSELQKSFKAIEARPHTLLARLPADAPMFASFSTNPDSEGGLRTRLFEWAMSIGFRGNMPAGYAEVMKEYLQATGGEVAVAAHKPPTSEGLTLTTLLTVRDEAKLRAAMRRSKEVVLTDKQVLENNKAAGMTVNYRKDAYKIGTVPVDTLEVKFEKGKNPMDRLAPFGEAITDLWSSHTAIASDVAVAGFGKDARSTLEAFLGGKVTGGLDKAAGPVRAFRLAVKDPVGILYVAPIEAAKRMSLGGKNPFAGPFKDLAGTQGVALSFTARDGVLEVMLDVPSEQAKNVSQGLARAPGVMPQ